MTIKTPEQIADEYLSVAHGVRAHGNTSPAPMTWWGVRDQIVAAIEADRAQRDAAMSDAIRQYRRLVDDEREYEEYLDQEFWGDRD